VDFLSSLRSRNRGNYIVKPYSEHLLLIRQHVYISVVLRIKKETASVGNIRTEVTWFTCRRRVVVVS